MIKLLSTDFDGTLVDHFVQPPVVPELFDALAELRSRGVLWAVNTGRELHHILEGLAEFHFPIDPDFVLTAEREVFHRKSDGGWQDFGDWNSRCVSAHADLFAKAGPLLQDIRAFLAANVKAHPIFEGEHMIGLATETDADMDRVCEFLEKERARIPGFQFMRNTVYIRFCHEDYSKGTALAELARLMEIGRDEIFAAGDHYNDLPMLDGLFAKYVACPVNSVDAVKQVVRNAGGYVAEGAASAGIVEALHHFGALSGRVGAAAEI